MDKDEYLSILTSKYNWFTPEEKKKDMSDHIIISYVYCHWDFFEIYNIFNFMKI